MKKAVLVYCASCILIAGCAGISSVNYSRSDRGRKVTRIAVVAFNHTTADRYQMWSWTKKKPHIVPRDTFDEQIIALLAPKTDCQIIPAETTREVLKKLNLEGKPRLGRRDLLSIRHMTGADAVLCADVSFYLQNYLFYKTFGLVEITMRLVSTPDDKLLWEAKGRNFALFVTTDSALNKVRDKMIAQLAKKLAQDKSLGL